MKDKPDVAAPALAGTSGSRTFGCVRIDYYPQFGAPGVNVFWFLGNNQVDLHLFTPSSPNYDQGDKVSANCKVVDGRYAVAFEDGRYALDGSFSYCSYDFVNKRWLCTPFQGRIGDGKLSQ